MCPSPHEAPELSEGKELPTFPIGSYHTAMKLPHLIAATFALSAVACTNLQNRTMKPPSPLFLNGPVMFTDFPYTLSTRIGDSIDITGVNVNVKSEVLGDSNMVHYIHPKKVDSKTATYTIHRTVGGVRSDIITIRSWVERPPVTFSFAGARMGGTLKKAGLQDGGLIGQLENYDIQLRFPIESFQVIAFPSGKMARLSTPGQFLSEEQFAMLNSIEPPFPVILDSIVVRYQDGIAVHGPLIFYVK